MRRVVVVLMAGAMLLAGCLGGNEEAVSFNGHQYNPPVDAPDFTLTDQNGNNISLSDFDGKVVVVAFTYTSCVDVCPIIEANMNYMAGELGDSYGEDVVYLSITIDPLRDTPEVLAQYVTDNGYDWPHLTSTNFELLKDMWSNWGVAVNSSMIDMHINGEMDSDHDMDGESMMHSVVTMMPDNSTSEYQVNSTHLPENATGYNLTTMAFNMNNINFTAPESQYGHLMENISGAEAPVDSSWWWSLYLWNGTNSTWEESQVGIDGVDISHHRQHIAWAASNANISNLPTPTPEQCGGHGWVMGEGSSAHCMCDDGYQWDGDDHLICISGDGQGTHDDHGSDENTEDAEEVYDVGHSTVTYIVDKNGQKRVAWVGSDWHVDDFLADIYALMGHSNDSGHDDHSSH